MDDDFDEYEGDEPAHQHEPLNRFDVAYFIVAIPHAAVKATDFLLEVIEGEVARRSALVDERRRFTRQASNEINLLTGGDA